jgi:3-oxoacyl-[acyl-carrier-protein] synthase II
VTYRITGMGAAASVGQGVAELFANLCAGRTGLADLRGLDLTRFEATRAYEIDDRPEPGVDIPRRATRLLVAAVAEALQDAGLDPDLRDVPVFIGTGLRELRSLELRWQDGVEFAAEEMDFGPALRQRFGTVAAYTVANACAASLCALALGVDLLDVGGAHVVVVAGVDVLTASMHGLLQRVQPTTPDRVRPFDRDRAGVLLGDGAAAVVLSRQGDGPGAALGMLRSVAVNCDAYHVTAPDPASIATVIRDAHCRAGVKPQQVDLVMAHGTGTALNDAAEAAALGDVFGEHVGVPLVTAIKSMTGHTSGASGLMSLVIAVQAIRHGVVPPTLGLENPAEGAGRFRFVRGESARADICLAQVNAFGFGGINAVALVGAAP